jgi:hypothetical protein
LLFVVLGSSLGVFGAWGIVVFGLVVGLAIFIREVKSFRDHVKLQIVASATSGAISTARQVGFSSLLIASFPRLPPDCPQKL